MKVVNDRINQLWRQSPGTVFLSVTSQLKVIESRHIRCRDEVMSTFNVHSVCSWAIPPKKETLRVISVISPIGYGDDFQQILGPWACTRSQILCLDRLSGLRRNWRPRPSRIALLLPVNNLAMGNSANFMDSRGSHVRPMMSRVRVHIENICCTVNVCKISHSCATGSRDDIRDHTPAL